MKNILLLGGCNWLLRELLDLLLIKKEYFTLKCIDNLSSEYSSRSFSHNYEYLGNEVFEYIYGDINNIELLKKYITDDTIIIYNIWNQIDSFNGFINVLSLCKDKNKVIYTTNKEQSQLFTHYIEKINFKNITGICYEAELIGNYDIFNKLDKIDTLLYYKKIGNNIHIDLNFHYYTMNSCASFIYFFLKDDVCEPLFICQPKQLYNTIYNE